MEEVVAEEEEDVVEVEVEVDDEAAVNTIGAGTNLALATEAL